MDGLQASSRRSGVQRCEFPCGVDQSQIDTLLSGFVYHAPALQIGKQKAPLIACRIRDANACHVFDAYEDYGPGVTRTKKALADTRKSWPSISYLRKPGGHLWCKQPSSRARRKSKSGWNVLNHAGDTFEIKQQTGACPVLKDLPLSREKLSRRQRAAATQGIVQRAAAEYAESLCCLTLLEVALLLSGDGRRDLVVSFLHHDCHRTSSSFVARHDSETLTSRDLNSRHNVGLLSFCPVQHSHKCVRAIYLHTTYTHQATCHLYLSYWKLDPRLRCN